MKQLIFFFLFLSLSIISSGATLVHPEVPFQGETDARHDQELNQLKSRLGLVDQNEKLSTVTEEKIRKIEQFIKTQIDLLKDSAHLNKKVNLIEKHGYSDEKAHKSAVKATGEGADLLAPFLLAQEEIEKLKTQKAELSVQEQNRRFENILLFVSAGFSVSPKKITTSLVNRAKNLAENFFEFSFNDSMAVQASNLIKSVRDGEVLFYTGQELLQMQKSKQDLSLIDPPSSSVWKNNKIENFDPNSEEFLAQKLFPDKSIAVPEFEYDRMGNGQVKFKADFYDPSDLNKKGEPRKKSVTIRTGWEAYTSTVVHQLARILGYHAIPTVFRAKIKLKLRNTTFDEFMAAYRRVHTNEQGSITNVVERISGENAVYIYNTSLEAYPDDDQYRKMGPFRLAGHSLKNRREFRALVLFNTLISLQDHFGYQARVDAWKNPMTTTWEPLFFLADTSSALGLPAFLGNKGTVNEFTWRMSQKHNGDLRLFWLSFFDPKTWDNVTVSDVKWLARRMGRISSEQIDLILKNSGFPEPVQDLYADKIKSRINHLIEDLDLKENYRAHSVLGRKALHQKHPNYIDEQGFLKPTAQEYPGNNYPILGNRYTVPQAIAVGAIQLFQNKLLDLFNPAELLKLQDKTFSLGSHQLETGEIYNAERKISVNHNVSQVQKRYLVKDRLVMSLPIGKFSEGIKQPFTLYSTFSFEITTSVSTIDDIRKKPFFYLLNPFSLNQIKADLKLGDQLLVRHGYGASIGHLGYKHSEDLEIEATLLGFEHQTIKSIYFSQVNEQLTEVIVSKQRDTSIGSQLTLDSYLKFGLGWNTKRSNSNKQVYRIWAMEESARQVTDDAFRKALLNNDFSELNTLINPIAVDEKTRSGATHFKFALWGIHRQDSRAIVSVNGVTHLLSTDFSGSERSFDRLWSTKLDPKAVEAPINYFGDFTNESKSFDFAFEGTLSTKSTTDFLKLDQAQLKITISVVDNYLQKSELQNEVIPFYSAMAGEKDYIMYQVPEGISAFPLFTSTMKWQVSRQGIQNILLYAQDWDNLAELQQEMPVTEAGQAVDPREIVSYKAGLLLELLGGVDIKKHYYTRWGSQIKSEKHFNKFKEEFLRDRASDLIEIIKLVIGPEGQRMAKVRFWAEDKNLWILTSFGNVLDLSHPTFNTDAGDHYWAKEIGRHQGFTELQKFYLKNSIQQTLDKE